MVETLPSFAYRPDWLRKFPGARLAVVGAEGFIGSHVAAAALSAGARVDAFHSRDPWRLAALENERLRIAELPSSLPDADAVALLSYSPPPASADPLAHELAVNVAQTVRLAEQARSKGSRVVFASSADVYGPWHDEPVTEDTPPEPATPYARAKLEAESRLHELGGCVSLRISTVFGPSEHTARAIPSFISSLARGEEAVLHGDGGDVRDYVYVGDVAAAFVIAAFDSKPLPALLNLGSGQGRTTLEVLRAIADVVGVEPNARFQPSLRAPSRLVLNTSHAAESLGFVAHQDFKVFLEEESCWLDRYSSSQCNRI